MKKILICAATELELKPIKKILKSYTSIQYFVHQVGIPLSLYYLNNFIDKNKINLMIQVGIGGSFSKEYPLESVAIIQKDCFGDMGVFEADKFTSIFEKGFIKKNQKPFSNTWLINKYLKEFKQIKLPRANAITVQQISTDKKKIKIFKEKYNVHIESMEGACLHFIGLDKNIPFLQIRSISNFIGEQDKSKWRIGNALTNLAIETEQIIKKIY